MAHFNQGFRGDVILSPLRNPCYLKLCKDNPYEGGLRSTLAARAEAAGLSPEVEKPGLLPARPTEVGFCEAGTSATAQARRPADVYIPQWGLRGPAAFDLAVASGLRGDVLAASAADGSRASAAYEARKRSHQHTEAQCDAQGLQFVPLVAEACGGGWGKTAMITWRTLDPSFQPGQGNPQA